jgi:rhodanese-related sulfurtransferase
MASESGSDNRAEVAPDEEESAEDRPNVAETLEPERVAEMQRLGEAHLIDVRQVEEWERGRIAGSVHIVLEEVTERAADVPRDRPVVFACRGGSRSAMVADAFRGDGYDAYNMAGGLRAWEQAGLPLEGDDGTVG